MAFNSEEYGWKDLQVVMLGRPVIAIRGLKYKESQTKENIYARGNKPISRSRGQIQFEGEITVLQSELRALLQSQGNGRSIMTIKPFDVVAAYVPEDGGQVSTDILKYVEFLECEIDINNGDQMTEHTLPVIIGDIEWNV